MMLRWLVTGTVLLAAAFFLPGISTEHWVNLNVAGVTAAVYVLALLFYTLRDPISRRALIAAWVVSIAVLASIATMWTGMDATAHWQKDQLLNIKQVISRGFITAEVPFEKLLPAFEAYHKQGPKKKETLGQVFRRLNPDATIGANIYQSRWEGDSLSVFVHALSDSVIVLVAQEAYVAGRQPAFPNYNGRTGMVQETFTLTPSGIRHESEN
jgi:hypothetical protein